MLRKALGKGVTDLPWLRGSKASLTAAMQAGRLPHALLLSAYPGWGAAQLGAWLALQVLGHSRTDDVHQLAHPDFRLLTPERGVIPVGEVRRLTEFGQRAPQLAPAKAALIEDADRMNLNAANALLKSLEEPPADTYLILTSQRAGALLPTVRSRCQKVTVPRDAAAAAAWLGDAETRDLLADYGGAPLLAAAGAAAGERPLAGLLRELAHSDAERSAELLEELLALDPVLLGARWLRFLVSAMAGEGAGLGLAADRRTFAFVDELMWFHQQATQASSVNVRLQLERLCFRWRALLHR